VAAEDSDVSPDGCYESVGYWSLEHDAYARNSLMLLPMLLLSLLLGYCKFNADSRYV